MEGKGCSLESWIPACAGMRVLGAHGSAPRGGRYTPDNIRERLRSTGQATGGPPPFGPSDRQAFANALDRLLAQARR
jgi:hypothetical protein